jgi:hypothetical protein
MAGYKYNFGTNQYPEFSNTPYADSTYGRMGANTPAAKRNQQTPPNPTGDAWAAFGQAAAQWRRPAPPGAPPTTPAQAPTPGAVPNKEYTPASLAGVIQGTNTGYTGQMPPQQPLPASVGGPSRGGGPVTDGTGYTAGPIDLVQVAPSVGPAPITAGAPPSRGAATGDYGQVAPTAPAAPTKPPFGPTPPPTRAPVGAPGAVPTPQPSPGFAPPPQYRPIGAPSATPLPQPGQVDLGWTAASQARRGQDDGDGPLIPSTVPIAPVTPIVPGGSGPRNIATDPSADPSTPAGLAGIITGASGGPVTGTGGQVAGTPPPGDPNAPRGSGGSLGGAQGGGPASSAAVPGTEGWGDFERGKLNEYINGGYYFLKDDPNMLARYWQDQGRTGEKGVDLPDWLAAQYPTIDWSRVPENARPGRMGYDTWRFSDANGTPRGFGLQTGGAPMAGNFRGAPAASPWIGGGAPNTGGSPYGTDRAIQGQTDAAWLAAQQAQQQPQAPVSSGATVPSPQTAQGGPDPLFNPLGLGNTGTGPTPYPGTTPTGNGSSTKVPPIRPPEQTPFGPGVEGGTESYVSRLLDPLHQQQQQELLRVLRQQGANEGTINSGGFGDIVGKAEGSLIAQQGAQKAQFISDSENRALQKYGIDQNKIIAEMQDATQRFGIQTNADLERWLNSADSNTLQKYGIDKDDLLARYKADLEASGQKYAADRQVDAARLSAGATRSAAGAAASAAMREAQLRYQLGHEQLEQGGAQFNQQNLLDWANLQAGLYNNDANRQLGWSTLAAQLGLTPAQLAQILQGYQPPAPIYNAP